MLAIVTSHPIQYQAPLWRSLAAAGVKFEVWFLTPHAVEPSFDREFGRTFAWDTDLLTGYSHRFLPVQPGWRLDRFRGIKLGRSWSSLLSESKVSSLWLEGWRFSALWQAAHAAHDMGIKLLLRGETNDLQPRRGPAAWLRSSLLRWHFSRFDHFLFIGSANRRFYEKHGVSSAKLVPAPYAVDNDRFTSLVKATSEQKLEWRKKHGISPTAIVPLFCGKLIDKKRPQDVIAAAAIWQNVGGPPLHLLFAGDGNLRALVERQLKEAGVAGTLLGFVNQSELPEVYAASDLLVLPSDHGETWGLVVNEAMAAGLPCAVSDHCGCAEDMVYPIDPARVAPCGDVRLLAKAMASCLEHRPHEEQMVRSILGQHHPKTTAENVAKLSMRH